MIFRQLFDATSGTYTYLLASRRGGEALIIDPVLEKVDRYLQLIARTRPEAGKADRHPPARRPHHRARRAARPHALHHRDGRAVQRGRRVHAHRRRRPAGHRGHQPGRCLYTRPYRRLLQLHHAGPRVHRRHAADPRHRPHRFPERRSARAVRVDLPSPAAPAGRNHGVPGARLQRRHGQHDRRGEALQSAPSGEVGRRICRSDEQPEPVQPEDDGRRGTGQHAPGPGAAGDRAPRLGGHRRSRRGRWSAAATSC